MKTARVLCVEDNVQILAHDLRRPTFLWGEHPIGDIQRGIKIHLGNSA
jgi:hypothetical protein